MCVTTTPGPRCAIIIMMGRSGDPASGAFAGKRVVHRLVTVDARTRVSRYHLIAPMHYGIRSDSSISASRPAQFFAGSRY
jgi:hypothetical protein